VGSGLAGGVASTLVGGGSTSVGASGAVFGLLAAAVVELAIHRKAYPRRWSGALLGMLLFLGAANIAIGFLYEVIDQSCHLGGLAAGALLGIALSRKHRFARRRWMQPVAIGLAAVCGGAIAWGGFRATTSDLSQTIASYPRVTRHLRGVTVDAPAPWQPQGDGELYDESMVIVVRLFQPEDPVLSSQGVLDKVEWWREIERKELAKKSLGLDGAHTVEDRLLPLPAPWVSRELEIRTDEGVVGEQRIRIAVIARANGTRLWLGSIYYPASLADSIAPAVADMLRSAR
jgi:hypothetical protein